MPTAEQIREALEKMAKNSGPAVSNIAKVKSVDETAATCILIDEDEQEYLNVRLRPVLTGKKSFILVPKVDTFVLAIRVEDDEDWLVIACEEIQKMKYNIGNTVFELTDKVRVEAGGENLAKLMDDLFTAIGNMVFVTPSGNTTALVNTAEFTQLKTRFKTLLK